MPKDDTVSRLTVDIPAGLHRKLKVTAAQRGTEIRALVIYSIDEAFRGGFRQVTTEELERLIPRKATKAGDRR
jgi:hypothetical protein